MKYTKRKQVLNGFKVAQVTCIVPLAVIAFALVAVVVALALEQNVPFQIFVPIIIGLVACPVGLAKCSRKNAEKKADEMGLKDE
jgi:hypothetical protein